MRDGYAVAAPPQTTALEAKMKRYHAMLFLILLAASSANAWTDLVIENDTDQSVWAGFDITKLNLVKKGDLAKLNNPDGLEVYIKNANQMCAYKHGEYLKVEVSDKPNQFVVTKDGQEQEPQHCK